MKFVSSLLLLLGLTSFSVVTGEEECPGGVCSSSSSIPSGVDECTLFLAPTSLAEEGIYGVFTSVDIPEGAVIGSEELVVPLLDKFKTVPYRGQHRWLSWLDYVRGTTQFLIPKNKPLDSIDPKKLKRSPTGLQFVDGEYRIDAFVPGLPALAIAHPKLANIQLGLSVKDAAGQGAANGATTPHNKVQYVATKPISAGSELYIAPTAEDIKTKEFPRRARQSITTNWLKKNGQCIDNLKVAPSTIPQAGKGAFAKRSLEKGSVIAPSSLAVIKREDLIRFKANETAKHYEKVLDKDTVIGMELLLNYAFGHPDSPLLLVPLSPTVNFINHNADAPNAAIRWTEDAKDWLKKHPLEMIDLSGTPKIEYVALRDIGPDEEIFLDYGSGWQDAWNRHVETHVKPDFVSVADFLKDEANAKIQFTSEATHPENLQTICKFPFKKKFTECWLPCDIDGLTEEGKYSVSYSADKHGELARRMVAWDECASGKDTLMSKKLSSGSITLMEKWGTTPDHSTNVFRHEIGVPEGMYPELWFESAIYELMPITTPLKPGQHLPISYAHNGKPVTRNAYFVGLPTGFNKHMYDFCESVGVMDMFRDVLNGRYNAFGTHRYVDMKEGQYYVQRPHWNSNMHWIIPNDEVGRRSYLRALGRGGFDDVLDAFGTSHGLNQLTCFHNTFLGISQADDSNMHADFYETQRMSFDFLLPLIMAENSTKPELHLQSADGNVIVGVKYRYGVAVVLGDWTYHKSAPVDYTDTEQIRVVSSIYCSEITERNRESILGMYYEEHPAPFYHLFDLPIKEWHWDPEGTRLPK